MRSSSSRANRTRHSAATVTLGALLEAARPALKLRGARLPPAVASHVLPTVGLYNPLHPWTVQVWDRNAARQVSSLTPAARSALPAQLAQAGMRLWIRCGRSALQPTLRHWREAGIACLSSAMPSVRVVHQLRSQLLTLTESHTLEHGVLLRVHGQGVLLTGAAGTGKSALALDLLSRGHQLVSDDAIEVVQRAGALLVGQRPALLSGYLERRGLGILDVRRLYGVGALRKRQRIDLEVRLTQRAGQSAAARLQGTRSRRWVLGVVLPVHRLAVSGGTSVAAAIEALCLDHALRSTGHDAVQEFSARQLRALQQASA